MIKKENIYLVMMISLLTKCVEIQHPLEEVVNKNNKKFKTFLIVKIQMVDFY